VTPRPRILVVGAGGFGLEHLGEWRRLRDEGAVELVGVVTRHPEAPAGRGWSEVPVHGDLDAALGVGVDAVDIVTPSATHAELVRRCLPQAHVLVEKPLACDEREAGELGELSRRLGRVLMVGHLFRFHPVVRELKRRVGDLSERPRGIEARMTNPVDGRPREEANLELLHLFDIIDFLFGVEPEVVVGRGDGRVNRLSLRYPGPMNAQLRIGWEGEVKRRVLSLAYSDRRLTADLVDNSLVVSTRNNQLDKTFFPRAPEALRAELMAFLGALRDPASPHPDATVGERVVRVALSGRPRAAPERPRIAVVGGGIFGATCALELARIGQVALFERHAELLTETSFNNQWRHHSGFHYPRSYDTIQEIKAARREFEVEYEPAIVRSFPAYFCTSRTGIEIPAERYLAACQSNELAFSAEAPPPEVLDRSRVSLCLKTDEAVYDVPLLRRLVTERLAANPAIRLHTRTDVVSGVMTGGGTKRLMVVGPDGTREESFDYLVNATYANRNRIAAWFGFPLEPLRFDLYELLLLRLPIPQICVTILDGPFTSLVGTGPDGRFLLSHIHQSVSHSVIPTDGMPPQWVERSSNRANMLSHSARYLPILEKATDVESRWATRTVNAYARDFDARPTVITDHGFGCWSLLGGKIITCVTNAREIVREIQGEQRSHGARATVPSAS
jgi:predicted dehydrogenase/glycine/D-amino acid oxidase-like deaminating enzyme